MTLSKNVSIAIVAVVAVAAVGAAIVAVLGLMDPVEKGVTYDGNGGKTSDGETSVKYSNAEAVINMFSYSGHIFVCWNTARDGSGTDYEVGDPVSEGMTLYAKWAESPLSVSSYSCSSAGIDKGTLSFTINGRSLGLASQFYSPAIIVADFGTGWTCDSEESIFSGYMGGTQITLKIGITGCTEGSVIGEVYDDHPRVGFKATDNIGVSISVSAVV